MRVGVLCSPESWYLSDLRRAARNEHEIVGLSFRDLEARFASDAVHLLTAHGPQGQPADLTEFDAILIRTMPPGSLEQVVVRMDMLGLLEARGTLLINPPRAIEVAVDKFLSLARLSAAGLRVPQTFVCQTADAALAAFDQLGGSAVLKPLFGSEGRGITRLAERSLAERAFRLLASHGEVIYLQEFIDHPGYDVRILVVGEQTIAFRRRNAGDWRTNLSRGARAERIEPCANTLAWAHRAAAAVGASLAGVDLIEDAQGRWHVLEVNAVPGWKATAAALDLDIGRLVLDHVTRLVQQHRDR